jgi:hypothetical protein
MSRRPKLQRLKSWNGIPDRSARGKQTEAAGVTILWQEYRERVSVNPKVAFGTGGLRFASTGVSAVSLRIRRLGVFQPITNSAPKRLW